MNFKETSEFMVSIRLMTYNHGNFIEDALRGIDMQQTNFNFEVVIGDDFSTDATLSKIKNFQFVNLKLIVNILNRKNGDSYDVLRQNKGRLFNFIDIINNCSGKYIALLDGDDYWTDPLKLQKQVDFLEGNKEYGICFHNVLQLNTFDNLKNCIIPNIVDDMDFTINDYILSNRTATCSLMFKSGVFNPIPIWFEKLPYGDLGLVLMVLKNSNRKGRVLFDTMGVYRVHSKSIHGKYLKNNKTLIKTSIHHLDFINKIEKYLLVEREYSDTIFIKKKQTLQHLINYYKKNSPIKYYKYKLLLIVLTNKIKN